MELYHPISYFLPLIKPQDFGEGTISQISHAEIPSHRSEVWESGFATLQTGPGPTLRILWDLREAKATCTESLYLGSVLPLVLASVPLTYVKELQRKDNFSSRLKYPFWGTHALLLPGPLQTHIEGVYNLLRLTEAPYPVREGRPVYGVSPTCIFLGGAIPIISSCKSMNVVFSNSSHMILLVLLKYSRL